MKPFSTDHGSVTTTRHSSCSCGSSPSLTCVRCSASEASSARAAVGAGARCGRVGIEHHDAERLAEVGAGDDAGLDRAVHHQPVLDRRRRDVLALAGLEQVLDAAGDAQVALGVERALVAGVQPAVGGERFGASAPAPCSSRASGPGSCTWISPLAGSMRVSHAVVRQADGAGALACRAAWRARRRSSRSCRRPRQIEAEAVYQRSSSGGIGAAPPAAKLHCVEAERAAAPSCATMPPRIGMPQQPLQLRRRHLGVTPCWNLTHRRGTEKNTVGRARCRSATKVSRLSAKNTCMPVASSACSTSVRSATCASGR